MDEPIVRSRMPELDTIRGIAILAVLAFHGVFDKEYVTFANPWHRVALLAALQGWAGVNLFFVLSGFLITTILLKSVNKPGYYSRFYWRRALRILPAYYLMLALIVALNYLSRTPPRTIWSFAGLSFIYLSNVAPIFGVTVLYWIFWSLSVEEHFYLLWPAVIRRLSRRGVAIIAVSICAIEPALRLYALYARRELWWAGGGHAGSFRYTWLASDGLALGALLALFALSPWGSRKNFLKFTWITFATSVAISAVSLFVSQPLALGIRGTVVNYFSAALVAGALWLGTGPHRSWVNIRVLAFYGYISYGLYLVHGWIFELYDNVVSNLAPQLVPGVNFGNICIRFVVVLAVSTAVAYVSRITYEEYFLRMKQKAPQAQKSEEAAAVA